MTPDRQDLDLYRSLIPPPNGRYVLRALRTAEGKMVGNMALFDVEEETRWEIAYDLDPEHWGKGLGSMMVDFLVQWAGVIGVKTISAVSPSPLPLNVEETLIRMIEGRHT